MMGLSGWCRSVMRMPSLTEAIASSRTRRRSWTAFDDRRGGLGDALVTDHLYPIQIARQFIHAIPNLGGIALLGGLLERRADLGDGVEPIAAARPFHAMPQNPDRLEITPLHGVQHRGDVLPPVLQEARDQLRDLGVHADGDLLRLVVVRLGRHFVMLMMYSWIAFSRIAFLIGLVRWAVHPASRLFWISSCKANAESAMIGVGGRPVSFSHCLIFLVAAYPSTTGICMSIKTRSNLRALNFATAMAPLSARSR